ncbi:docking protein 3 isoform X2 [Diceros bicornis minor]|uniref:docking protein 3 isoform X2 n=1 Tax=Diceros bicornis minor TaxID=77932 RepID=UPI0026EAF323|nr:docking protein 3 isoform X2 [Diceros bicornis minor]
MRTKGLLLGPLCSQAAWSSQKRPPGGRGSPAPKAAQCLLRPSEWRPGGPAAAMEPVETPVKDGILYQQHIKFGKKSWRKVWGLLYAGGPSGVARLESWEVRDGGLGPAGDRSAGPGRRGERRVIRLADCVSVLPADGESCPRDTGAFLLTTTERSLLLAAQHRQAWMDPICQLAFPGTGECPSGSGEAEAPKRGLVPMEENSIYSSWQEGGEFPVVVQRTEAAARCQLKGPYCLVLGQDAIQLREPASPQALYTWPYRFLRKFGSDKGVFSFEAGRRCDSGEGFFAFGSPRARDLCGAVAAAIARQREWLPELAGPRPCPLPRATSLPSLDPPGELREAPPGPEPPSSWRARLAEPGPQSLPPVLGPVPPAEPVLYASVCKRARGPQGAIEHLYENLSVLEAGSRSPLGSPVYHNHEDLGWPGPAHDSSLEAQYRRLLELDNDNGDGDGNGNGIGDEAAGSGRAGAHAGFKAKLVTLLSRERKKGPAPCDRP